MSDICVLGLNGLWARVDENAGLQRVGFHEALSPIQKGSFIGKIRHGGSTWQKALHELVCTDAQRLQTVD
jgi:hypothetical protein